MNNIYHEHLANLRNIKVSSSPAISIYVPLKWVDYKPESMFAALLKVANGLLAKEGYPRLELSGLKWESWIKQGTVTLAIFHHAGITTLIPLPTRMQPRVIVANSFHIKPILTAANEYVDALLLHFNESGASLYRINAVGETLIDSYLPSKSLAKYDWPSNLDKSSLKEFLEFLKLEIKGSWLMSTKLVGITGTGFSELRSESFWNKSKLPVVFCDDSLKFGVPQNSFSIMRLRLSQIVNKKHSTSVVEALNLSPKMSEDSNVRSLGEKILTRQISHLCVSLDDMHFGELDYQTGATVLNRVQASSKDDDLLDDLVELAIDNGIKVSVVPKKYLPAGRSFVAS